ncbi:MAG: hypothetical protein ABI533_09435, partial [Betaproteobacteria bacterium]
GARIDEGVLPWILHGRGFDDAVLARSHETQWRLARRFVLPAARAPATVIVTGARTAILSRIDGIGVGLDHSMFGASHTWGTREDGFHAPEIADFGSFRYTTGDAWIDLPAGTLDDAAVVKADLIVYGRKPAQRATEIRIGDRIAWKGMLATGITTLRVPVVPADHGRARIRIVSDTVDPSELGAGDTRVLGVGVIGLRPMPADATTESGPDMAAFRATLGVVGEIVEPVNASATGSQALILDLRNAGTAYWPSFREHPEPAGVVKIALQWYRRDRPEVKVGDNRWPLAVSMLGSDHMRVRVPLHAFADGGAPFSAGDYVVRISMVREGFALFANEEPVTIAVRVTR